MVIVPHYLGVVGLFVVCESGNGQTSGAFGWDFTWEGGVEVVAGALYWWVRKDFVHSTLFRAGANKLSESIRSYIWMFWWDVVWYRSWGSTGLFRLIRVTKIPWHFMLNLKIIFVNRVLHFLDFKLIQKINFLRSLLFHSIIAKGSEGLFIFTIGSSSNEDLSG